jgi:prolyl-tRNA synthetase
MAAAMLVIACGETPQEQAEQLAQQAAACCGEGRLDEARILIDSLRRTYPDIVEARKAALKLHQDVELKIAQQELARTDSLLVLANRELEARQQQVDAHKAALKATAEELTLLTRTRMRRDSIRTQYETLGMKIRYIRKKQKETQEQEP